MKRFMKFPGAPGIALVALLVGGTAFAQDPEPPHVPGMVQGSGTSFEITDSDYLNVALVTDDSVTVVLESNLEVISLHIEGLPNVTATHATMSGLPPSAELYRYDNGFENGAVIETDAAGVYAFDLDLSQPYHIVIRPEPSTIFLGADGWSQPVGTWDPVTRTGTLTQDVTETIEVNAPGITLDGAGHSVNVPKSYGIYVRFKCAPPLPCKPPDPCPPTPPCEAMITNVIVSSAVWGIHVEKSERVRVSNNVIASSGYGIGIFEGTSCRVESNTIGPVPGQKLKRGCDLTNVSRSTYACNSVTGADQGNQLMGCSDDTLKYNSFAMTNEPIVLSRCSGLVVFNNSFVSAAGKAPWIDAACGNLRFNQPVPIGGNYWNVWTTPDDDHDGFVDKSYEFKPWKDQLPLTTPGARYHTVATILGPASGSLYPVGSTVAFSGSFTNPGTGDVHDAVWAFDGIQVPGVVSEGMRLVSGKYTFDTAGVYMVSLTVTDGCGSSSTATTVDGLDAMVVVYDPNAGFVTGGGWIPSPAGADARNPAAEGKANFGFVSKYRKGASMPTGETEFQFKAGDLNFRSLSYDWLVIAGAKAQYKGVGTINGTGDYGFMLTAVDGDVNGGGGVDRFRIKIHDRDGGGLVYDNQPGAPDNAVPTTVLGGGSIVIHSTGSGGGGALALANSGAVATTPREFRLEPIRPNPFARATNLRFWLPEAARVTLVVCDVTGRIVNPLLDETRPPGWYGVDWAGIDAKGVRVRPGVYFFRVTVAPSSGAPGSTSLRKVIRMD